MALRSGHGVGKGTPRIEVLPPDELPVGVPAPSGGDNSDGAEPQPEIRRVNGGRVADAESAAVLGRLGGLAKAEAERRRAQCVRLAETLGLDTSSAEAFAKYADAADAFHQHEVDRLAETVGGGFCGAGPASIVATAAIQRAGSAYAYDLGAATGDVDMMLKASRLGNDSRQNLLAAHELCAREAAARPPPDPLAAVRARMAAVVLPKKEPTA